MKFLEEVATFEDIEDVTNEHVLLWLCRVEAQMEQNQPLMT